MAAAAPIGKFIATVMPKEWNMGRAPSMTSLPISRSGNQTRSCCMLYDRLRCVSIAPLAMPVVPPVYWRTARSSSAGRAPGGSGGVSLMSRLKKCRPGPRATFAVAGGCARFNFRGASRLSGKRRYSGIEAIT